MKEGTTVGLTFIGVILFALALTGGITAGMQYNIDQENKIVLGEGIVSDMGIQNDGGLSSWEMYLVTIEGKEFEVSEEQYYVINIGDYIIIYKGGKVEIQ